MQTPTFFLDMPARRTVGKPFLVTDENAPALRAAQAETLTTLHDYQARSREYATYPTLGHRVVYPALELGGEAGEVTEKIKKVIRDQDGEFTDAQRMEIAKELGDVLWDISQIASELGIPLDFVARLNLAKLYDRRRRGVINGSGDNR